MSFFTQASFVMDPNVYGVGKLYVPKPTDGSGDLTFTRASNGTRVNQDGLIEKVRTNEFLYSNAFDNAAWSASSGLTFTGGQTGYDGSSDAWLMTKTALTYRNIGQSITTSSVYTISVYAKAGTISTMALRGADASSHYVLFNLSTGTKNDVGGVVRSTMTDVGSGWWYCTATFGQTTSYPQIYVGYNDATAGNIYIQDAQLESGDIATDYIATTSAAVSVGPLANIPRLNYGADGCPSLLLEPQRTNLVTYSEQMDNAAWTKNGVTVTANATTSPDGYTNADKIVETAITGPHGLAPTYSIASSTTYTFSIFAKKAENDYVIMNIYTGVTSTFTWFNVANGTLGTIGSGATAKIENYGNGWYRCSLTVTTAATGSPNIFMWTARVDNQIEYTGNGTNGTFIWGCQLEAGGYATSYINTLSSAVTRVADACYKTGISSLIGQTEGTIFMDYEKTNSSIGEPIWLSDGTYNNFIYLSEGSNMSFYGVSGANQWSIASGTLANGRHKIAAAYKQNDIVFYIDGVQIGTDTSANVPTCSLLGLGYENGSIYNNANPYKQALLFKTRLSNADLARLTSL